MDSRLRGNDGSKDSGKARLTFCDSLLRGNDGGFLYGFDLFTASTPEQDVGWESAAHPTKLSGAAYS